MRHTPWRARGANGCAATRAGVSRITAGTGERERVNGEEGVGATYDVDVLRGAEFPWTSDTVYLNNASIGLSRSGLG